MIRRPSTAAQLYAWHRSKLAGEDPPMHDGLAECGWFKRRMVKGGPWVPVRIFVERDIDPATQELTAPERLMADVGGKIECPGRHWTHLTAISRREYEDLLYRGALDPNLTSYTTPIDLTKEPVKWT